MPVNPPLSMTRRTRIGSAALAGTVATLLAISGCASGPSPSEPSPSESSQDEKPRVGFVAGAGGYPDMAVTNQTFFDGLAESGYEDGTTMDVVFRTAEGNMSQMPTLVDEVLADGVDILVVSSSPGCAAAKAATSSVPVLCISVQDDPVRENLTTSLDHGEGNVVGVHSYLPDGIEQQLELLRELDPELTRLGILYNPDNDTHLRLFESWQEHASTQGIEIIAVPAGKPDELDRAIVEAQGQDVQLTLGLLGADTYAMMQEIADAADAHDFPIALDTPGGYTDMGGVAVIGVDIVPLYRQGALEQMVPMLEGTPPDDLPWIGPDEVTMKVNDEVAARFDLAGASQEDAGA
jgi:putative ABC transport system substrate-binding protein